MNYKKISFAVCLSLLCMLLFSSCQGLGEPNGKSDTSGGKPQKIKIGIINSFNAPKQISKLFIDETSKNNRLALLTIDLGPSDMRDSRTSGAEHIVNQLANIDMDAIGLIFTSKDENERCLKLGKFKKIPMFTVTSDKQKISPTVSLMISPIKIGDQIIDYMSGLLNKKGNLVILYDNAPNAKEMVDVMENKIKNYPELKNMGSFKIDPLTEKQNYEMRTNQPQGLITIDEISLKKKILDVLKDKSDADGVIVVSEVLPLATYDVLKELKMDTVKLVAFHEGTVAARKVIEDPIFVANISPDLENAVHEAIQGIIKYYDEGKKGAPSTIEVGAIIKDKEYYKKNPPVNIPMPGEGTKPGEIKPGVIDPGNAGPDNPALPGKGEPIPSDSAPMKPMQPPGGFAPPDKGPGAPPQGLPPGAPGSPQDGKRPMPQKDKP